MSDISIPGISNNRGMDTNKMVEDLMEVERIPVRRMEREVEQFQLQRETWQSLGRTLSALRDSSRRLYGFENPFRDRLAESSNTSALTASASRQAPEGITELTVLETAGRDRMASASLERSTRVPAGNYQFQLGEVSRSMRFSGGTLREFADQINRRVQDVVRANVVPNTSTTEIIIFEGMGEGADQRLTFHQDALTMAKEFGVLRESQPSGMIQLLQDTPVRLDPGAQETLSLPERFQVTDAMILTLEVRTIEAPQERPELPPLPPGPTVPSPGSVTFQGVTVENERPDLGLPAVPERDEPPQLVENNQVMTLVDRGDQKALPEFPVSEEFTTVTLPAHQLLQNLESFQLNNQNTDRVVEVRNIRVQDPTAVDEGLVAANPLQTARDARILYSGIEITRSSNEVDDLIPGVTLQLRRPSTEPIEVEVRPNREAAKDAIIEFIGFYNQVIRDINIYTRNDSSILDQIDHFTDAERETMERRMGIFQGESTLSQLRTRMQTVLMDPYPTGDDSTLRLLAEIGISSNASGLGGGVDTSRMRGYMEINESQLDRALNEQFSYVGRLFGFDTTGDLVANSGAAVAMERFATPYVQTGGIIASRSSSINSRISQAETRLSRINEQLERTEQRLRSEFGRMDGALQQLQEQSRSLDNLQGMGNSN